MARVNYARRHRFRSPLTPPQLLAVVYLVGILLSTALLHLPHLQNPETKLSSVDLLFMATSAISVTGLTVSNVGQDFTRLGEIVFLLLIQVGGLGILTFSTLLSLLAGKRINFSNRQYLMTQINALDVGGVIALLRTILTYTFVSELLGALLLSFRFVPEFGWSEGMFQAIFHAVSAYNNGGIVILPSGLGEYATDPLIMLTISVLVILGALGFLVQFNVIMHLLNPLKHRLMLYSKLTLGMTIALLLIGTGLILLLEWSNPQTLGPFDPLSKIVLAFFHSMTPRSGGFATIDMNHLHLGSLMIIMALMYIGGSSGSTGGGLKVSTFAVLLGSTWNMVRGRGDLIVFQRRIASEHVLKAGTIVTLYTLLVAAAFFLLLVSNSHLEFSHLLFETLSAAATVGLSMGATTEVNDTGLLILTLLMYLGRIGPITFAAAFSLTAKASSEIEYPREPEILLG